ncbi:hypothetical protein M404DRAFT_1002522 [Pisolithus tinctorius Marx 270]|uniref:Uncharacterized protein n=1 Tax=Pisolithus tinctorius Marx 270 TaxID=870435 RepID=A0A0C3P480_PISTI|nr:hypothetical protein M404DRAFT_1002522 [Pisolithus tinctorius Marx 270]
MGWSFSAKRTTQYQGPHGRRVKSSAGADQTHYTHSPNRHHHSAYLGVPLLVFRTTPLIDG